MELLAMPDEVLLYVFRFLPLEDVLLSREVCRRFRDLLLDPFLWKHRHVLDYIGSEIVLAVLQVAPSLQILYLSEHSSAVVADARACSTSCAVESLCVRVDHVNGEQAVQFVQRQAALGRLRSLDIEFWEGLRINSGDFFSLLNKVLADQFGIDVEEEKDEVWCQLSKIFHVDAVRELSITYHGYRELPAVDSPPNQAFLKKLSYESSIRNPHLLWSLLDIHAATLEVVKFGDFVERGGWVEPRHLPVSKLSQISNLRELECSVMDDMRGLLQCTKLQSIFLFVYTGDTEALAAASSFFKSAVQLKSVDLFFGPVKGDHDPKLVLVPALGASGGAAALTSLTLHCSDNRKALFWDSDDEDEDSNQDSEDEEAEPVDVGAVFARALMAALPGLPHLTTLKMTEHASTEILRMICPAVAPSLRVLKVMPPPGCRHAWIHQAEVQGVMERNPSLHLLFWVSAPCSEGAQVCGTCQLDCHSELRSGKSWRYAGLYSHPAGIPCEFHKEGRVWVRA